jgi:hypothetical protein
MPPKDGGHSDDQSTPHPEQVGDPEREDSYAGDSNRVGHPGERQRSKSTIYLI